MEWSAILARLKLISHPIHVLLKNTHEEKQAEGCRRGVLLAFNKNNNESEWNEEAGMSAKSKLSYSVGVFILCKLTQQFPLIFLRAESFLVISNA